MIDLLHSPFLGANSWLLVREAMADAGIGSQIIDLAAAARMGDGYYGPLSQAAAAQLADNSVLVAHSAAGALVPSIARAAPRKLSAVVFVDALLPHPGRSWLDTAPAPMREAIIQRSEQGLAPPWHALVPGRLLEGLIPDRRLREALAQGCPRLPLTHLREVAPRLAVPPGVPVAYLQLSAGYADEAQHAERVGWPVLRRDGHHLWPLTHPRDVADALIEAVSRLQGQR